MGRMIKLGDWAEALEAELMKGKGEFLHLGRMVVEPKCQGEEC